MLNPHPQPDFVQLIEQAWGRQLHLLRLLENADQLVAGGHEPLAAVLYQTWLKRNRTTHDHLAWFNLGVILFNQKDWDSAREAYSRALQLNPQFLQPRFNLGLVYEQMGQSDSATAQWLHIASSAAADNPEERPVLLLALNNLGRHYEDQHRYAEAQAALTRSLLIEPNQPQVIHHWVFQRAKQCVWPVYQPLGGLTEEAQRQNTSAMAMISLSEDPAMQLAAARHYVASSLNLDVPRLAPGKPYGHRKLRIAYCSSDFCLHPVAMLTVQLFELHDREQFEIYGFDWSREDNSPLRQRVEAAMDHFIRIHHLSDQAAAELIREHEIDILVDLQGQTLGARANMLAYRPAPIQITYLGLPATTGLPFIDYVIADRYLIPESAQPYYSEKPLYLPDIYQASDRLREVGPTPTRADCGLPEHGFVFCSFNNNYKFNPSVFAAWMRIMQRVPGSVLWLLADNVWAQENLRRAALEYGITGDRLYFAPRLLPQHYLARLAVADLFLDTYPFNAGTTANDALWMGLPVLTMSGQTFASRMAGALLTAAGLPELIAPNLQAYEDKAVALAQSPADCQRLRQHLADTREHGVLFDTPRFVQHLEAAFQQLCATTLH
ncbi:tetratricopeptide repeat protein [Alicycliphilus denitrificans]|uniref:O-linked N-acetylglucosamine transferase, SPINDLY family protein n=1 Tax=Alicycliphilus denitrificans TaxID=179636 RepID=UPI0038511D4A